MHNKKAEEFYRDLIEKGFIGKNSARGIAVSDASYFDDLGVSYTEFEVENANAGNIFSKLKTARTRVGRENSICLKNKLRYALAYLTS